jgi:glucokinase
MSALRAWLGLDVGGTAVSVAAVSEDGTQLISQLLEYPSHFKDGPDQCLQQLLWVFGETARQFPQYQFVGIGLDYPGPADKQGRIRPEGTVNSPNKEWGGFNLAQALAEALSLPVCYDNDCNAAGRWAYNALYCGKPGHHVVGVAVGTGCGGFDVRDGVVFTGTGGKAAEYGHHYVPAHLIVEPGQPLPVCQCGRIGDLESFASRKGIENWLSKWFLEKAEGHPLRTLDSNTASLAGEVRRMGSAGDPVCRAIFAQQAKAIGLMFSNLAVDLDPDTFVIGGGIFESVSSEFIDWYLSVVRDNLQLDADQQQYVQLVPMPNGDQAAARGMALLARSLG